jgi:hypothetical protein
MSQVIIGTDPHKRSSTIEIVDRGEAVLGAGRYDTDRDGDLVADALEPYLADIRRRLDLDMTTAAQDTAAGVLAGLHACDGAQTDDGVLAHVADCIPTPTQSSRPREARHATARADAGRKSAPPRRRTATKRTRPPPRRCATTASGARTYS